MTRHMRNAVIVPGVEYQGDLCRVATTSDDITAPVAIAFTEEEVVHLADLIDAAGISARGELSRRVVEIVRAAADEVEANDFEPPLHEEDA